MFMTKKYQARFNRLEAVKIYKKKQQYFACTPMRFDVSTGVDIPTLNIASNIDIIIVSSALYPKNRVVRL